MIKHLLLVTLLPLVSLALDGSHICKGEWNWKNNFERLVSLVKDSERNTSYDGFHVKRETCKTSYPGFVDFPPEMTAYLSDDDYYLYLYIKVSDTITRTIGAHQTIYTVNPTKYLPLNGVKYLFVLWLNESHPGYNVVYESKQIRNEITIKSNHQIVLSDTFSTDRDTSIKFQFTNSGSDDPIPDIDRSYVIVCSKRKQQAVRAYEFDTCAPEVNGRSIYCNCEPVLPNNFPFVIIGLFWIITIIAVIVLIFFNLNEKNQKSPPAMAINCNTKTYKYYYSIVLRFGKASANFDLANTWIDFEFFDEKNDSLGPMYRLPARFIESKSIAEIEIKMFRFSKMPTIRKIHCYHSGLREARIYLFGLFVIKRHERNVSTDKSPTDDDRRIDIYKVNEYIVRDSRRMNAKLVSADTEEDDVDLTSINIEVQMSKLEIVWILFNIVSLIACLCLLLPNISYRHERLVVITIISVLCATVAAIPYGAFLIYIYKCIKREEMRDKLSMSESSKWTYIKYTIIVVLVSLSIAFCVTTFILGEKQSKLETLYWFCAVVCSLCIWISIWILVSHISFGRKASVDDDDYADSVTQDDSI